MRFSIGMAAVMMAFAVPSVSIAGLLVEYSNTPSASADAPKSPSSRAPYVATEAAAAPVNRVTPSKPSVAARTAPASKSLETRTQTTVAKSEATATRVNEQPAPHVVTQTPAAAPIQVSAPVQAQPAPVAVPAPQVAASPAAPQVQFVPYVQPQVVIQPMPYMQMVPYMQPMQPMAYMQPAPYAQPAPPQAGAYPPAAPQFAPQAPAQQVAYEPAPASPVASARGKQESRLKPVEPRVAATEVNGSSAEVKHALNEAKAPVWIVKPGSSLRSVINEFAARAGWAVDINYRDEHSLEDKDLVLGGGLRTEGDFKKAINDVFNALPPSVKIRAELWPENTPPTVFIYREGARK